MSTATIEGISADTLAAVRAAQQAPIGGDALAKATTTQGITTTTAIRGYNLEAPSKKLFPVLSPLRNRFPRIGGMFGNAVSWKAITAINAAKLKAGVAEGTRNSALSTTTDDKLAAFKSIGFDGFTTDEAQWQGRRFEDVKALDVANTLSALMTEEEKLILGGNVTAIGKPASLTIVDSNNAGPFTAATAYRFAVSALTSYGYLNGATGHGSVDAVDESDGRQTDFTTGGGKTAVTASWPAVRGAVAYNIFVKATASASPFYAFTTFQTSITIDSTVLAAIPSSGNVPNSADQTADALAFDGLIPQIAKSGSGAYFRDLGGATLTADNAGGIVEWDVALKALYDSARVGPSVIWVSSQEATNGPKKIGTAGTAGAIQLVQQIGPDGSVSGGIQMKRYLNKYTGQWTPVETHPFLAPGTTMFLTERLPFPVNEVPNVIDVAVLNEYTQYDWARVQRKDEYGVYASEVLRLFFPAGQGLIVGQANG